jgi:phenylalanyl-tRNA synthetase beta chain
LDSKTHILHGGDIVAVDGNKHIVDLLGVMGLENSVVTENTKRILFFVNNTEPTHVRKTSMQLGIRTEAAVLNEKGLDPELAMDALLYGIKLFKELAGAKMVSEIIDIYPNKVKPQTVTVSEEQINRVIGINIPLEKSVEILQSLGFHVEIPSPFKGEGKGEGKKMLITTPPSFRAKDIAIPEDIIEEIARIYGYHNIPNTLPTANANEKITLEKNEFYWEDRIKDAMKYWGFTETYTYPMISKEIYEGSTDDAVTIQNPLNEDLAYMRRTLVPSLLKVIKENPDHEVVKLFEIANVYEKKHNDLPLQTIKLAGVIKTTKVSLFEVKGVIEQLLTDLEIKNPLWKPSEAKNGAQGASIYLHSPSPSRGEGQGEGEKVRAKTDLGQIQIISDNIITFELNLQTLLHHATLKKTYKPISKFPPSMEDLALIAPQHITVEEIIDLIKKQHPLIADVSLLDKYQETRTFHIIYQSYEKNLTSQEVGEIREKILKVLREKLNARLKE